MVLDAAGVESRPLAHASATGLCQESGLCEWRERIAVQERAVFAERALCLGRRRVTRGRQRYYYLCFHLRRSFTPERYEAVRQRNSSRPVRRERA